MPIIRLFAQKHSDDENISTWMCRTTWATLTTVTTDMACQWLH